MSVSPQVQLRWRRQAGVEGGKVLEQLWMGTKTISPAKKETIREWRQVPTVDAEVEKVGVEEPLNTDEEGYAPIYIGDRVEKTKGDYTFKGIVVARFRKYRELDDSMFSGPLRYVVQSREGVLHIFSRTQLTKVA